MTLQLNAIVRTSYGTGPYQVTELAGPCSCPHPVHNALASEPHYHMACKTLDGKGGYSLGGYRLDGTSVWSRDRLAFEGMAPGATPDLFTEVAPGTNLSLF